MRLSFFASAGALGVGLCSFENLLADGVGIDGSKVYQDPQGLAVLYGGSPRAQAKADAALREWFSRNAARL